MWEPGGSYLKFEVSATAASTWKVFVRQFGWNFETNFLLSLAALENLSLLLKTLEGNSRQEPQNELGANKQQGRKNSFYWQPNSGQQYEQAEGKWRKIICLKSLG